jgi:hypothetical protein
MRKCQVEEAAADRYLTLKIKSETFDEKTDVKTTFKDVAGSRGC